ncbi:MAG: hypothetical protein SGPRY_010250, partial [Prymnesium sp.]
MQGVFTELANELAELRTRDAAPMDPADLDRHRRRKAELKYMIKHKIPPPPRAEPSVASTIQRVLTDSLPSFPPPTAGATGYSFPTLTLPLLEDLPNFAGTVSFGSMVGFCSGYALKKVGRASAATLGLIFMGITAAEKADWLTVKWENVERDVMSKASAAVDFDGDGTLNSADARKALHQFTEYMTDKNSA